jgi:hypothetical protein
MIKGVITSLPAGALRGSIRVSGSEAYCTFMLNKLTTDSHRPSVGSEVWFNSQTVYIDNKTYLTVYRILLDPSVIESTRAFVAPPHLLSACSALSLTPQNFFIGDFDQGALALSGSPVFDHRDFVQHFPPSETLDSFTLQRVIDLVVKKYAYQESRLLGSLEEEAVQLGLSQVEKKKFHRH